MNANSSNQPATEKAATYEELQKKAYRAEMRYCALMFRSAKVDPYSTDRSETESRMATYLDCAKTYNRISV